GLYASVPEARMMTASPPPDRAIIHWNAASTSVPPPINTTPPCVLVFISAVSPTMPKDAGRRSLSPPELSPFVGDRSPEPLQQSASNSNQTLLNQTIRFIP